VSAKPLKIKIAALRRELADAEAELGRSDAHPHTDIRFTDLFDLDEIQAIQDAFAKATGVGSLITTPEGEPITKPSNFCTLCQDVIRKTPKGMANCMHSDAAIGKLNPMGPIMQPCLSSGLWDGGASISVGGRHIANWLIGQVRNEELDARKVLAYAKDIGADEAEFARHLDKVTIMPLEQFEQVCEALFLLANLMSWIAYQNVLLVDSIAELRASHDEVDHLKSFLSNIIDSMPSMLVGVDPEGRITHWNMRASEATGIGRSEVEGRLLVDVLPSLAGEMNKVIKAISDRRPVLAEKVTREEDGTRRYNDVSVYPLVANGVQGAVIRIDDITERVRIEEMMIQSEKMLSVGGLAAGMAHEINNPLAAILGNAHLLKKRLLTDTPKNRRVAAECGTDLDAVSEYIRKRGIDGMLDAITESGQRAGRVVTNMLCFSRKSDGQCRSEDVTTILDKAVELVKSGHDLENSYNFKDIEFVREYVNPPSCVICDAGKLQQVFFNILNNGAQAMTGDHAATGRTPRFVLRCRPEGTNTHIEIEDNGPGMPEAIRKRVFEPFFTTKQPGVGTGLGMSVSYFIITEAMGGTMTVTSTPGQGATFIIDLPAAPDTDEISPG
jgi:PAS domain S-box-containing protein